MSKAKVLTPQVRAAQEAAGQLDILAQYNAECARGIVHTPEWDERMATLQARFDTDTAQEAQWEAELYTGRRRKRVGLK